jgi:hypothetical protein
LLHGAAPKVYLATLEAQRAAAGLGDNRLVLLRTLQRELKLLQFCRRPYDALGLFASSADKSRLKASVDAQQIKVDAAADAVRQDPAAWPFVTSTNSAFIISNGEKLDKRIEGIDIIAHPLDGLLGAAASDLAASVRPKSSSKIAGENDFEGFRPGTKGGWDQYFLPPGMKISKAITQGISSCAGGVTFVNEKMPGVIILWHIDFPPWVPIKEIIQQLWPEKCPDLRTLAFVYPDCAELNKYRPAMIYPEPVRERCQTVFMTRGDHLGVEDFSLGSGSENFGLDLSNPKRPDLVFTHDINKRTEMLNKRTNKSSDADVSITLDSFHKNVFGSYRYDTIPVVGGDREAMKTYTTTVARTDDDTVKRNKLGKCSVVRLQGVGSGLFDAVEKVATPVLDTPCFLLGLRVEQEFGQATPEIQAGRAWRTGHHDRATKAKEEKKA